MSKTSSNSCSKILDLSKAEGNILTSSDVAEAARIDPESMSLLPDRKTYQALRKSIASLYGVGFENVALGNGSDELIEILARIHAGGVSMTLAPCFERLFEVNEKFDLETSIIALPVDDEYKYTKEFHALFLSRIKSLRPDIIWLCSPNNPTGSILRPSYLQEIAAALKEATIVVDAAFIDISSQNLANEYIDIVRNYSNVVFLSSFSKTWGISALRIGFLITSSELVETVMRQCIMFNVNTVAVDVARRCIDNSEYRSSEFSSIREHLTLIRSAVKLMPQYELIANSDLNVFCLRLKSCSGLHERLAALGIKTKRLDMMPGMENAGFCRILVPRKIEDVMRLTDALSSID